MITVLIVALVLGAYYYPSAPKILKDNKQMLLGVFVGLLAGQYLGVKIEGARFAPLDEMEHAIERLIRPARMHG